MKKIEHYTKRATLDRETGKFQLDLKPNERLVLVDHSFPWVYATIERTTEVPSRILKRPDPGTRMKRSRFSGR